ncbi:dienelactone hydrolase-like protein [Polyplosphaeria fusca]|uniref:Dienelactone hydrolase-like protein n=1 Tax=Polyplosphaeria fusca TaxID=682080 RepID=A0A9P4V7D1_9PLEO|nr:dienelactone hydrolase-like protein [Polyplosphaeria fusca]
MDQQGNPYYAASPDTPPQQISRNITLQTPLSRRGYGPGLVLVLDHYAAVEKAEGKLDPPPLQKWAEEGFCVVQVLVPAKEEDGGEFPLKRALEILQGEGRCEGDGKEVGLISYLSRIPFYVEEAACLSPSIKAIVSYGGRAFSSINTDATTIAPQLLHIAGKPLARRESMSIVPDSDSHAALARVSTSSPAKSFRYESAARDCNWILPSDEHYHAASAGLAHTRSLSFLKPFLQGPYFDLEAVWEEHCMYEFGARDVDKTMATMVAEPYVNHIPMLTGGVGKGPLAHFYANHFVHVNPPDTELEVVSRTVGVDRVIDEFVGKLTHDRVVDWLLPGVPPTGKYLEIPFTSVICMRGDRLSHEHIHWDSSTAFHQLGLVPEWVKFPYAIDEKEAASGKRFEVRLPTVGVETARKLVEEGSVKSNELIERGLQWREVDDA